jgi:hypothetical protein
MSNLFDSSVRTCIVRDTGESTKKEGVKKKTGKQKEKKTSEDDEDRTENNLVKNGTTRLGQDKHENRKASLSSRQSTCLQ